MDCVLFFFGKKASSQKTLCLLSDEVRNDVTNKVDIMK